MEYKVSVRVIAGKSAVVVWDDPEAIVNPSACIVDASYLGDAKPGDAVYISKDALDTRTPYGLDWSVFYPDGLTVTPQAIQTVMYQHGIITMNDLRTHASEIPTILAHLYVDLGIQLYSYVKQEVGA